MSDTVRSTTYSRSMIAMHWGVVILIAATFAAIEFRELFEKGSAPRENLKSIHFMLGITVLALTLARLFMRARVTAPLILPQPQVWQTYAAKLVHVAIYSFMIGLPVLGWLTLSAAGKPIPYFGLTLPPLIGESKDAATWLKELHHELGQIFYFVIGAHAAAALAHHYIIKDNTLTRMLPSAPTR